MIIHKTLITAPTIYTENKKIYTCSCYEILFQPVNNREIGKIIADYQPIGFLHTCILSCYFLCNAPVPALLRPVIR